MDKYRNYKTLLKKQPLTSLYYSIMSKQNIFVVLIGFSLFVLGCYSGGMESIPHYVFDPLTELKNVVKDIQIIKQQEPSLSLEEFENRYSSIEKRLLNLYNQPLDAGNKADVIMKLGELYLFKLVDYEKAIKFFKELIQKYPQSSYVFGAEVGIKQCKKALPIIQRNLSILKDNPKEEVAVRCLLEIAEIYGSNINGSFKARQTCWEIYKRYPLSEKAPYALSKMLSGLYKDIDEAIEIGVIIVENYPKFEEYENSKDHLICAMLNESVSAEKLEQIYQTAKSPFVKAMSLFGLARKNCEINELSTDHKRGKILYNKEGIRLLRKVDQEFPKTEVGDDTVANIALHYYSNNDLKNFEETLLLMKKKYPNGTDILHSYEDVQYKWVPALMLAYCEMILNLKKDRQKAREVYQEIIEKYPNSYVITVFFTISMFGVAGAEAQKEIAEIYLEQKEFEKALMEYKRLVLEFPDAVYGTCNSCDIRYYRVYSLDQVASVSNRLNNQQLLDNMLKEIVKLSKSEKVLVCCHNYMAESALNKGDYKTAITYYKKAADLSSPENILRVCLEKLNNPLLGIKELEEIKRDSPKDETLKGCAIYLIAKTYHDELKDLKKAANLFKEFIINYPNGCGNEMEGPYYGTEEPFEKIAIIYKEDKDYDGLRKELDEIYEKCDDIIIKTKSLFVIAQTFELQSDKDKAVETYIRLINQYPNSHEAKEAKKRLEEN